MKLILSEIILMISLSSYASNQKVLEDSYTRIQNLRDYESEFESELGIKQLKRAKDQTWNKHTAYRYMEQIIRRQEQIISEQKTIIEFLDN